MKQSARSGKYNEHAYVDHKNHSLNLNLQLLL